MYVPQQHEILAKALELGVDLKAPGARARVAQVVAAERDAADTPTPEQPARQNGPEPILVSRSVSTVAGGQIVVDVHFIPNDQHEEKNRDDRAAAARPAAAAAVRPGDDAGPDADLRAAGAGAAGGDGPGDGRG